MFELVFGCIWTAFVALLTFLFYGTNTSVQVNGNVVSHEEFVKMLDGKIIFAVLWAAGIYILIRGIKKIIADHKTDVYGEECFGIVTKIFESGAIANGKPQFKAMVEAYVSSTGETLYLSEVVGYGTTEYGVGDYISVKYYNGDINILGHADKETIPQHVLTYLEDKEKLLRNTNNETI